MEINLIVSNKKIGRIFNFTKSVNPKFISLFLLFIIIKFNNKWSLEKVEIIKDKININEGLSSLIKLTFIYGFSVKLTSKNGLYWNKQK